jgi:hypothetical protein
MVLEYKYIYLPYIYPIFMAQFCRFLYSSTMVTMLRIWESAKFLVTPSLWDSPHLKNHPANPPFAGQLAVKMD